MIFEFKQPDIRHLHEQARLQDIIDYVMKHVDSLVESQPLIERISTAKQKIEAVGGTFGHVSEKGELPVLTGLTPGTEMLLCLNDGGVYVKEAPISDTTKPIDWQMLPPDFFQFELFFERKSS